MAKAHRGSISTRPELHFSRRPSTIAYTLRAFHRTPRLERVTRFPPVCVRWTGQRGDAAHFDAFARLTGLGEASLGAGILYPQVVGFPLQMAVLTHPAFPVPIWRALQIRNHLVWHRPMRRDEVLDWETSVGGQRFLEKGAEVDLHTTARSRGTLMWEGLNTFYFRRTGRGEDAASALARPPRVADEVAARWHMPAGVGWSFARLTGDFNGIHLWDWYAHRFGFRRAFHHPPLVAGQCLARLQGPAALPQRLDLWLKGPVFYDSEVRLVAEHGDGEVSFALHGGGDERPAMIGRWHALAAGERLLP